MGSVDSTVNHRFCGVDKCDADHKCTTPCPNGDECPTGESCFDDTPCSSTVAPPTYDFAYCGTSETDAVSTCWQPCRDDNDCCYDQTCYNSTTECQAPNFQGSAHFFCGTGECYILCTSCCCSNSRIYDINTSFYLFNPLLITFHQDLCDASFRCSKPCPSGFDAECDIGESCYANTPCDAGSNTNVRYGLPRSAMNLARQYIRDPMQYIPEPMQYVPGLGFLSNGAGTCTLFGTQSLSIIALSFVVDLLFVNYY